MIRPIIHLFLHLVAPGVVAWIGFQPSWKRAWGVMLLTMIVDLDHLLAEPMYDSARCSIGFHPLHTAPAIAGYVFLTLWPRTRIVGVGLLIHMILDGIDCLWMGMI